MSTKTKYTSPVREYQKTYLFWLSGIFLAGVVFIRLRLLGVSLECDEGEYACMAQQILHGVLPYTESRPVFIFVVNAPLSWVPVRPDFPSLLKNLELARSVAGRN